MKKTDVINLSNDQMRNEKEKATDFFIDDPLLKFIVSYEDKDAGNKSAWDHINEKIYYYQQELGWLSGEIRPDLYEKEQKLVKYYDSEGNLYDLDFIPPNKLRPTSGINVSYPSYLPTSSVDFDDSHCVNKAVALIYPYWKLFYKDNDKSLNMFPIAIDDTGYSGAIGAAASFFPGSRFWNGYFYKVDTGDWVRKTETSTSGLETAVISSNNGLTAFSHFRDGVSTSDTLLLSSIGVTNTSGTVSFTCTATSKPADGNYLVFSTATGVTTLAYITIVWIGTSSGSTPVTYTCTYSTIYKNGTFSNAQTNVNMSIQIPNFSNAEKVPSYSTAITKNGANFINVKNGYIELLDAWITSFKSGLFNTIHTWMNNSPNYINYYNGISAHVTNVNSIYTLSTTSTSRYSDANIDNITTLFSTRETYRTNRIATIKSQLGSVFNLNGYTTSFDPDYTSRSGLYLLRYKIALSRYNKMMGTNSVIYRQWEAKEVNNAAKDSKKASDSVVADLIIVSKIKEISLDRYGVFVNESTYSSFIGDVIIISDDIIGGNPLYFQTTVKSEQRLATTKKFKDGKTANPKKTLGRQTTLNSFKMLTLTDYVPWSWDTNTSGNIRIVKLLPEALPITD